MSEATENVVQVSGGNSRSCLTAGKSALNDTEHPSYFNAARLDNGNIVSVDMVRVRLQLMGDGGEWLSEHLQLVNCDDMTCWTSKIRPGGWYELWNFSFGDSSVSVGIGFMNGSCKVDMHRAFVEFNPNKLGSDQRFVKLLDFMKPHVAHADVKRFDLAMDVPRPRNDLRVTKDGRMYAAYVSNGLTEYLGRRNSDGFVKVYDKSAESDLSVPLTRIELTASGEWSPAEVCKHWPQVHGWHADSPSRDWTRVVGILLSEKVERGEEVESLISMLGRGSRPKVREYLRSALVELPVDAAEYCVRESRAWCERLSR